MMPLDTIRLCASPNNIYIRFRLKAQAFLALQSSGQFLPAKGMASN
jgi:hypothetical protein